MKNRKAFDFENKEDRHFLMRKCINGMINSFKFLGKDKAFSSFLTKEEDENKLTFILSKLIGDYEIKNFELFQLFKAFIQSYTIDENIKIILLRFFDGYGVRNLNKDKKLKGSWRYFLQVIEDFREKFAKHLKDVGYFEDTSFLFKGTKTQKIREQYMNLYMRNKGVLGVDTACNDYYIYKLIRDKNKVSECAEILGKSINDLEKVIFHKGTTKKLWLFEIQKLRVVLFPNIPLEKLVEC